MGWYFAALADVLEYMPKDHADYPDVLAIFNQVAAGLKRWQDPVSGVWYQLLQYDAQTAADGKGDTIKGKVYNVGTEANYLEASASGIFTYAYLKGIRLGLLDRDIFLPVAEKAYQVCLRPLFVSEKTVSWTWCRRVHRLVWDRPKIRLVRELSITTWQVRM